MTIIYTVSDGAISCTIDGETPPSGCESPIHLSDLTEANHTFSITAIDEANNRSTITRTWSVWILPIIDGQAADLALGQANTTDDANYPVNQSSIDFARGVVATNNRVWVSSGIDARILLWYAPGENNALANGVLGQTSFTTSTPGLSASQISGEGHLCVSNDALFFSDRLNHRVLRWDLDPSSGFPMSDEATLVLGQTEFNTNTSGNGASQFFYPGNLFCDSDTLIVADTDNDRVLIWSPLPITNGQPADIVLGRPDFGIGAETPSPFPPTSASMRFPSAIIFDSDSRRLFVSDGANNRVMVWNTFPTENGQPADFVLGQSSMTVSPRNAGMPTVNATGMEVPTGIVVYKNALFVGDARNRRIMVWKPVPSAMGEPAKAVLGTENLNTPAPVSGGIASFYDQPEGLGITFGRLFVGDDDRVVRFTMRY